MDIPNDCVPVGNARVHLWTHTYLVKDDTYEMSTDQAKVFGAVR
jgi:hypothetical protein